MLFPHFTFFFDVLCLDILKWKAFLIKPTVCSVLIIDVTIDASREWKKLIVNTTLNAYISISAQFLADLRNQALWNNFDLCLSDAVAISAWFKFAAMWFFSSVSLPVLLGRKKVFSSLCWWVFVDRIWSEQVYGLIAWLCSANQNAISPIYLVQFLIKAFIPRRLELFF